MGQLESLMKLNIAQSSHKKEKKKEKKSIPWLIHLMGIPLYYIIMLERYYNPLIIGYSIHTSRNLCSVLLLEFNLDLVKISKYLKVELIYLSLLMNENHCLCDALFLFDNMI
jgi:hypothetical protein